MNAQTLKFTIARKLEQLPESQLQTVLSFVDFLSWRNDAPHAEETASDISPWLEESLPEQVGNSVSTGYSGYDPITPLIGSLHLGTTDLAENHDRYIGEALEQELQPGE